ncbi:hypothetical protein [Bacteriophage sp.]|nr:hypothetical protein [Bacteriophage sp.]
MSSADSVSQNTQDSFSNYRLGKVTATQLNTAANAVITIPLLSGGLTSSGNSTTSGAVIVRRVTIQNPSGSVASANISIGTTNNGANLITANTVLSSVSAGATFQDISPTATLVSGNVTQCLYVNINTASGNANTVDIVVWGDVVSF